MRNQKITDLVYLALFLTIIIVMSQVPWLGFIPLGFTTATIIHIPVIIAAIYFGKKFGTLTGFIFGLSSFVTAYIRPTGVFDLFFQNPIISILPRIVFAFLTAVIFISLKKLKNVHIRITITAFLSSLIHTVLVLGTLFAVYYNQTKVFTPTDGNPQTLTITFALVGTVLFIQIAAEAVLSALVTAPIIKALKLANNK